MFIDPANDDKVQKVLSLLDEGKTKKEVAEEYQQGWKAIDMYMRRKGYRWDRDKQTYCPQQEKQDDPMTLNTKAAQIVRMLSNPQPNFQQIAIKHGFQTIEDLGVYMKSNGYVWNDEEENYSYDPTILQESVVSPAEQEVLQVSGVGLSEMHMLQFLMEHKTQLEQMLTASESSIQTYKFKGNKVGKTLTLASSMAVLLDDYSKEYNMTQRAVVETALAEFMLRHGYHEQLKMVTV